MPEAKANAQLCTSVFKNGKPTVQSFTAKWIELINRLEKEKAQLSQIKGNRK